MSRTPHRPSPRLQGFSHISCKQLISQPQLHPRPLSKRPPDHKRSSGLGNHRSHPSGGKLLDSFWCCSERSGNSSAPENPRNADEEPGCDADQTDKKIKGEGKQRRPPWMFQLIKSFSNFIKVVSKQWWAQTLGFFAVGILCSRLLLRGFNPAAQVMYSDFVVFVEAGMVQSAQFEHNSDHVYFTLKPEYLTKVGNQVRISLDKQRDVASGKSKKVKAKQELKATTAPGAKEGMAAASKKLGFKLMARTLPGQAAPLHELLRKQGVRFGVVGSSLQSTLSRLLGTLAVLWIPLVPLFWFFRRSLNAQNSKKTKKVGAATPKVLFSDIAGMDQAKTELLEVISLLKNPNKFSKLNIKIPSGVLLSGPTGTGKTLLARAVAGEAEVPFYAASASEFVEMFVGRGAARIRELFKEARRNSPCVVFIDEIDSVGGRRGFSMNDERDQTLNQLLVELDGFEGSQGFVLLAATNRPEVLDSALLRPGRLTRKIKVGFPDEGARSEILKVHMRDVPMGSMSDKEEACAYIAKLTFGFSGAELANVVNEGALLASREDRDSVLLRDLVKGVQRTRSGLTSEISPDSLVERLSNWMGQYNTRPRAQTGA